jgi:hypothetical protein
MIWLGSAYWICEHCHAIYVQRANAEPSQSVERAEKSANAK